MTWAIVGSAGILIATGVYSCFNTTTNPQEVKIFKERSNEIF